MIPAAKKPMGMATETIPWIMACFFPLQHSAIRIVVVTSTPPIPKPVRNLHMLTSSHDEESPVQMANTPKQAVESITERERPVLSQIIPHKMPPNIQPKIKRQLIHALTSFNCSSATLPDEPRNLPVPPGSVRRVYPKSHLTQSILSAGI